MRGEEEEKGGREGEGNSSADVADVADEMMGARKEVRIIRR
jgi:hypothetical protein